MQIVINTTAPVYGYRINLTIYLSVLDLDLLAAMQVRNKLRDLRIEYSTARLVRSTFQQAG